MLMCLVPKNKNKAEILTKICGMQKKEELFNETKIDTFKAVITLEIENLITEDEKEKLEGRIKMTPEAKELISQAINEVGRKYEYLEKQDLIEEGKKEVAKNLKDILTDEEISKRTGLDLKTIKQL